MAGGWFYSIDGTEHGPVSSTELAELARSGKLRPTDLVQKEGSEEWRPAGRVKGLFPSASESPSAASAAKNLFGAVADTAKRVGAKVAEAAKQLPKTHTGPGDATDAEPTPEPYTLPKPSRRTLIAAGFGSGLLLFSCVVCGLVGVLSSGGGVGDPKEAIVGTWEREGQSGSIWAFNADGTATETLTKVNKQSRYKYTVVDADKIDLVSDRDRGELLSDEMKEKVRLSGVSVGGTFRMASQYKFDGRDRLILLLGDSERPTRISEAERAEATTLGGKGGGLVVKLRRKKG